VWMQVLHLAGADAFWCVLVVLTATVTVIAADEPARAVHRSSRE
jgi:hypothetical protein